MSRLDGALALLANAVGEVFPAAQLVVVEGGHTVLDEAVGDCTRDTLFDIASLTKPLCTTTLLLRRLAEGCLRLDDALRPGVTVQLAMCHASGLPAWRPLHLAAAGRTDADARRAVVEAARCEPLEYAPGTRSVYSDLGYILLGDALERLDGLRLDEQSARLGLGLTFHPEPDRCAPTETEAGAALRGVVHDDNARAMEGVAGHAGLFGTACEVASAAMELSRCWHGARGGLVEPEWLRRAWSPVGIPDSTWCLGWDRPSPSGVSSAGTLWPRDGVGHLGYTGCSLWIDPPRRRCVVLLSNRVYARAMGKTAEHTQAAIKRLRPALHDAIVRAL